MTVKTCALCGGRDAVDVTEWDGRFVPCCGQCCAEISACEKPARHDRRLALLDKLRTLLRTELTVTSDVVQHRFGIADTSACQLLRTLYNEGFVEIGGKTHRQIIYRIIR